MVSSAPRIDSRLLAALDRLDDGTVPFAEVNRRLGVVAEHLGLARPSYEQVRVAIKARRRLGASPAAGELLLDVALRARPIGALEQLTEPRAHRRPRPK